MSIREIPAGAREPYVPLLLVGDEQEERVFSYLDRGRLFILEEDGPGEDLMSQLAALDGADLDAILPEMLDEWPEEAMLDGAEEEDPLRAVALVTDEGDGVCEVQNLAVVPAHQGQGFGTELMETLMRRLSGVFRTMRLGTGENPAVLRFYASLGFRETGRIPDWFREQYDHPILENGVELRDRICLERSLP